MVEFGKTNALTTTLKASRSAAMCLVSLVPGIYFAKTQFFDKMMSGEIPERIKNAKDVWEMIPWEVGLVFAPVPFGYFAFFALDYVYRHARYDYVRVPPSRFPLPEQGFVERLKQGIANFSGFWKAYAKSTWLGENKLQYNARVCDFYEEHIKKYPLDYIGHLQLAAGNVTLCDEEAMLRHFKRFTRTFQNKGIEYSFTGPVFTDVADLKMLANPSREDIFTFTIFNLLDGYFEGTAEGLEKLIEGNETAEAHLLVGHALQNLIDRGGKIPRDYIEHKDAQFRKGLEKKLAKEKPKRYGESNTEVLTVGDSLLKLTSKEAEAKNEAEQAQRSAQRLDASQSLLKQNAYRYAVGRWRTTFKLDTENKWVSAYLFEEGVSALDCVKNKDIRHAIVDYTAFDLLTIPTEELQRAHEREQMEAKMQDRAATICVTFDDPELAKDMLEGLEPSYAILEKWDTVADTDPHWENYLVAGKVIFRVDTDYKRTMQLPMGMAGQVVYTRDITWEEKEGDCAKHAEAYMGYGGKPIGRDKFFYAVLKAAEQRIDSLFVAWSKEGRESKHALRKDLLLNGLDMIEIIGKKFPSDYRQTKDALKKRELSYTRRLQLIGC